MGLPCEDDLGLAGVAHSPFALIGFGLWFTAQQDQRQQHIENQRAERELAEQRAQDGALQAYLDQMSTLLLERDLRESEDDSEV